MFQHQLFQDGRQRKTAGMQKVMNSDANWSDRATQKLDDWIEFVRLNKKIVYFTGENLRSHLMSLNQPEPHHPNAWSAVIGSATKRWQKHGLISHIGFEPAKRASRHAAIVRVYKVL